MEKKCKILLVEDDATLWEMYKSSLENAGFVVEIAKDGENGLNAVKKDKPDLILLDILLPRLDGYTVLKQLRSNSETKDIPVIIFSNLSQKEEIEKGYKLGAQDYVIKTSVTPKEMVMRVKEFLGKKHNV